MGELFDFFAFKHNKERIKQLEWKLRSNGYKKRNIKKIKKSVGKVNFLLNRGEL